MTNRQAGLARTHEARWLKQYYFVRAAFSVVWVALAFAVGRQSPMLGTALLIVYPAWDALANFVDMSRSGGMAENRTQALNVAISVVTTLAVIGTANLGRAATLDVFGAWAILSGLMQLGTALRRWKGFGAQWPMVLSGAQSALAGVLFIVQAGAVEPAAIVKVAGYAGVGAIYFLVSAVSMAIGDRRRAALRQS